MLTATAVMSPSLLFKFLGANSCFAWQIESELVMTLLLTLVMDRRTKFLHCGTVKKKKKEKERS